MIFLKKLLLNLHEKLPGKRVFFIYTNKNGYDRFAHGLKANTELSYWNYQALRSHFPRVTFLKLEKESSAKIAQIKSEDVVIGHIGETFLQASKRTKKMIAFYPWSGHLDRSENKLYNCLSKEEEWNYLDKACSIILLTSEYNVKQYIERANNYWHEYFTKLKPIKKIRVVHQPIDLTIFKRIKTSYTTSNFLYVGNNAHMKCLDDSKRLTAALNKEFHIYGVGPKRLNNLDSSAINELTSKADFFIQPGMWEGQCVAILEAAARGFIPAVSPETGYPYDHPYLLKYNDFEYNLKILKKLIALPTEEKKALADELHAKLQQDLNHNNWKKLTDVIVEEVRNIYS